MTDSHRHPSIRLWPQIGATSCGALQWDESVTECASVAVKHIVERVRCCPAWSILDNILFDTTVRESSSPPTMRLALRMSLFSVQHRPADVEAPQLPHKIETALTRPAEEKEVFLDQSSLLCRHVPGTYSSICPKGNINSISIMNFYFCFLPKSSSIFKTDQLRQSLKQISVSYFSTKWRTSSGQNSRLKVLNNITGRPLSSVHDQLLLSPFFHIFYSHLAVTYGIQHEATSLKCMKDVSRLNVYPDLCQYFCGGFVFHQSLSQTVL